MLRRLSRWSLAATLLVSPVSLGCASAPDVTLAPGDAAPTLRKTAHDGTVIDLSSLQGRPAVIYFYPKDGTPGCTTEACAFRDVWNDYEDAGVLLVGVSTDSDESHREFAAEHGLPFPLIADEDETWAKAFGVGSTLGMVARDTFLIGRDGKIAKVYRGVDPGVHAGEVLADAKAH